MLKASLCEATFTLTVNAKSPILVSKGKTEKRQGERMEYSRWITTRSRDKEESYIPASSFKGVLRSHAERILRSFSRGYACDPFAEADDLQRNLTLSCSKRIEELKEKGALPSTTIYRHLCPACRLFGCTSFAGRVLLDDIFPQTKNQPLREEHIAVDRFTQGVALGPFGRQPLDDLKFNVPVTVLNFELWQLGLLALVVLDMNEGLLPIGSGGRHGHGEVEAKIEQVQLRYVKTRLESKKSAKGFSLVGIGALLPDASASSYGYTEEPSAPAPADSQTRNGWNTFLLKDKDRNAFLRHCVRECLSPRLKGEAPFITPKEGETNA